MISAASIFVFLLAWYLSYAIISRIIDSCHHLFNFYLYPTEDKILCSSSVRRSLKLPKSPRLEVYPLLDTVESFIQKTESTVEWQEYQGLLLGETLSNAIKRSHILLS